jgi:hypothetical protein
MNTEELRIYVYYDNLVVSTTLERLVYDIPAFLSAMGGSLGLYLGFSCLEILFRTVDEVLNRYFPTKQKDNGLYKGEKKNVGQYKGKT